ncbi:hypothetical protein Taro_048571 [Colocasia esculenta]|uniref:Retrotransposon gag domain-containing protein n=1 Tax=Colocasia esculenta TaxID=4460 RepID=A0A843X8H6_COLES|nr:hypothetical protein [Colocasia esculenta]
MSALPKFHIHPLEMSSYRLYNGTGNSYIHVKEFLYESSHWQRDPFVLTFLSRKSLDGPTLEWLYSLEPREAEDFCILHKKFIHKYKDRANPSLSITDLASEKMRSDEDFIRFTDRWRSMATKLQHMHLEPEQIKIIISSSTPRFKHILAMDKITTMKELYERGLS